MKDFLILTLLLTLFVADLFFLVSYLVPLHKGGLDYRRMKTKRLNRLSVYVERKNVCKWSLVYLHVGNLLWSFFLTQFFSNIVESVLFYSGMVTREVKSGKRDFQDGETGRNSIAFRTVLCMWRKRPEKEGGIKGFTLFPPVPPCPKPALGERKRNSQIFYSVSRNVLFPVKEF